MQRTAVTFFDTQKRSRRKTIFYQKISYNEIISLNYFKNYYLPAQNFNNQTAYATITNCVGLKIHSTVLFWEKGIYL